MSPDNERVMDLCKRVTQEKDHDKLMTLVQELNQELDGGPGKKKSDSEKSDLEKPAVVPISGNTDFRRRRA